MRQYRIEAKDNSVLERIVLKIDSWIVVRTRDGVWSMSPPLSQGLEEGVVLFGEGHVDGGHVDSLRRPHTKPNAYLMSVLRLRSRLSDGKIAFMEGTVNTTTAYLFTILLSTASKLGQWLATTANQRSCRLQCIKTVGHPK